MPGRVYWFDRVELKPSVLSFPDATASSPECEGSGAVVVSLCVSQSRPVIKTRTSGSALAAWVGGTWD